MKNVYYFESKIYTEHEKFLRTDTVRISLCSGAPMYDYSVGHIEASVVAVNDNDTQEKLKRFLREAAKLYGEIVLEKKSKVRPLCVSRCK